jgi:hypothetical protein
MEIIVVLIVFGLLGFWVDLNNKENATKGDAFRASLAPYKVETPARVVVESAQDRVEAPVPVEAKAAPAKKAPAKIKAAPAKKAPAKKAPAKPRKTPAK